MARGAGDRRDPPPPPPLRRVPGLRCHCARPVRFIIFFLFKCHFVACGAVYKTECVLGGFRVSYHLSSFVAYKHNSTRSLARFVYCLRVRLRRVGSRAAGARLKISRNSSRSLREASGSHGRTREERSRTPSQPGRRCLASRGGVVLA